MGYTVVRCLILFLTFVVCVFAVKKIFKISTKRQVMISFAVSLILMQLFCIIPIENAFVTFSTPEKAYSYSESGITRLAINGEKTVFIVGESGDKDVYIIMPKSRDGYKLGFKFFQKTLLYNYNSMIINIYQYKDMGDYYISITDISGENFEITDNHNSEFYCLEKYQSHSNKTIYSYYAYIGDFNEQYTVIVNGQEIQF